MQQGAFAAAAFAGDGHEFAGGDFKVHPLKGLDLFRPPLVNLTHLLQFNHKESPGFLPAYGHIITTTPKI